MTKKTQVLKIEITGSGTREEIISDLKDIIIHIDSLSEKDVVDYLKRDYEGFSLNANIETR
jgi:hypothetical protein